MKRVHFWRVVTAATLGLAGPVLANPTCDDWQQASPTYQAAVVSQLIQQPSIGSLSFVTAACVRSLGQQIAVDVSKACRQQESDFARSADTAIAKATQYCQSL